MFGAYIANFAPTDSVKLCISGAANIPTYIDEVFVRPLTTTEIGYLPPVTLNTAQLVQANGNQLVVGSTLTPITLKGINVEAYNYGNDVPGTENAIDNFGWKNYDESSFKEIAGLGFNTVRLMMSFVVFEDNAMPGVYKNEGWAWLDRNIQWAKKYNLRLLLDMHEPPGGTQLPNKLDLTPTSKLRLENLWTAIAQRYQNETTIVGYDLINEPYVSNWFAYAPQLISKIRAVDPNHLIFIEQSYHPTDLGINSKLYPLPFANIVYDIHYYNTFASTDNGITPYTGSVAAAKASLMTEFAPFYNSITGKFTVPLNSGEYGVVHQKYASGINIGAEQWMNDLSAAMDAYGINRQMFAYHENRFGLYSGWQTYPRESTAINASMKGLIQQLNRVAVTPGTDTLPNAFSLAPKTAVLPATLVASLPIIISGIDVPTPVKVFNGAYSINGGAYTSAAGMVSNGNTLKVQHIAGSGNALKVSSKLIVGGAVSDFTSTTQDKIPNTFKFTAATKVLPSTLMVSNAIIVSGIDTPTTIRISAGSFYSINGGAYTSAAGIVRNGNSVKVSHTSSSMPATAVSTTLTIGGLSAIFKSTTK